MERILYYLAVVMVAAFLIVARVFSPVWLLFFAIVILWSQRAKRQVRLVFLVTVLLAVLYFVIHYFALLVPFIVGAALAYIFGPVVDWLEQRRIPRPVAVLGIIVPLFAVGPVLVFLVIVNLVGELEFLISKIPDVVAQTQVVFGVVVERLAEVGVQVDPTTVAATVTDYLGTITSTLIKTISQVGAGIMDLLFVAYNLIFIPLSAYLFLADNQKIDGWVKNMFRGRERERIAGFLERLNIRFARFFRGQIIYMIVVGLIVGFGLWAMGIRYYLLLSIIAALGNLVPNVGYVLSLIPALLIGIASPNPGATTLKILTVYVGEQLLENFVLGPLIIGKASRLHPVIVMIVLVLGGAIFGVWGVILAVPLTIFIREFLDYFLDLRL